MSGSGNRYFKNYLRQVGLDPEEASRKLGYFGTVQFLDNGLDYIDSKAGTPRVKSLAELIQTRRVSPPSFPNELAFTQVVPHQIDLPETDIWNWLERALNVE